MCGFQHLIPKYIKFKVKGNNTWSINTIHISGNVHLLVLPGFVNHLQCTEWTLWKWLSTTVSSFQAGHTCKVGVREGWTKILYSNIFRISQYNIVVLFSVIMHKNPVF